MERHRRLGHSRPAGVAHPRVDAGSVPRHGQPLRCGRGANLRLRRCRRERHRAVCRAPGGAEAC
eukprot:scaffold54171_cov69-Phaeocystis_antarctica.AAC.3